MISTIIVYKKGTIVNGTVPGGLLGSVVGGLGLGLGLAVAGAAADHGEVPYLPTCIALAVHGITVLPGMGPSSAPGALVTMFVSAALITVLLTELFTALLMVSRDCGASGHEALTG